MRWKLCFKNFSNSINVHKMIFLFLSPVSTHNNQWYSKTAADLKIIFIYESLALKARLPCRKMERMINSCAFVWGNNKLIFLQSASWNNGKLESSDEWCLFFEDKRKAHSSSRSWGHENRLQFSIHSKFIVCFSKIILSGSSKHRWHNIGMSALRLIKF